MRLAIESSPFDFQQTGAGSCSRPLGIVLRTEPKIQLCVGNIVNEMISARPDGIQLLSQRACEQDVRLSWAQKQLWTSKYRSRDLSDRHSVAFRIYGALDTAALAQAVAAVAARHASLRTVIDVAPNGVLQGTLLSPLGPETCLPSEMVEKVGLASRLASEAMRPFDPAFEGPFRAKLFQITPAEHVIMLTIHRHCGDPASLTILTREIGSAYTMREASDVRPGLHCQSSYAQLSEVRETQLERGNQISRQVEYLASPTVRRSLSFPHAGRSSACPDFWSTYQVQFR